MRVELSQRTQGLLAFLSYDTALPCTTAMAHAHAVMSGGMCGCANAANRAAARAIYTLQAI